MKRCFIAINIPQKIKNKLADVINQLKFKNSNKAIKYLEPKNIHLTLHFLGLLNGNEIKKIEDIISNTVKNFNHFKIETADFGAFPNFEKPRVLFIIGSGAIDIALKIQQTIGKKLITANFKIDSRLWKAHFTLARIKSPIKLNLENIKLPKLSFEVSSIELMQSELSPQGAKYSIISSHPLRYEN